MMGMHPGTLGGAGRWALAGTLSAALGWACNSPREGYAPEQPIAYSHELHAGELEIECRYCHVAVEEGRHASIPSTAICMNCHSGVGKDKDGVIKLTRQYEQQRSIPWVKVYDLPDFVYFDHQRHIAQGFDCDKCHGKLEEQATVTVAAAFNMGWCVDCHRNPEHPDQPELTGSIDCHICHR